MKKLLFFLSFLIAFNSYSQTPVYKQYYSNGIIKQECGYIDDVTGKIYAEYKEGRSTHGYCKFYKENGVIYREGLYVRGSRKGIFKDYNDKGNIMSINNYLDSVTVDGMSLYYCYDYPESIQFKSFYVDGKREGLSYAYSCGEPAFDRIVGSMVSVVLYRNGNRIKSLHQGGDFYGEDDLDFITFDDNLNITKNMKKMSPYDIKAMIRFFIDDAKKWGIKMRKNNIKSTFEQLEGNTLALAYGSDNDDVIFIKVDPENWENSSAPKRWYILYHELGHDVLNLDHGEGGKMMFNFSEKNYTWEEFNKDRAEMFYNYSTYYNN